MKKLFSLLFIAGAISLVACGGPSKEDEAARKAAEQKKIDSLFNAASKGISTAMDSVKKDSTANAPAMEEKK